jgi:O-antigen/teichoic acid export membrane protein
MPHMARLAHSDPGELRRLALHLLRIAVGIAVLLTVALTVFAEPLVLLLFGSEYAVSAGVLRIVVLSVPPFFATFILIGILEAVDQQNGCAMAMLQALAVATPVAGIAVWRFGIDGAAVAYVVAHVVLTALLLWRSRDVLRARQTGDALRLARRGVAHG